MSGWRFAAFAAAVVAAGCSALTPYPTAPLPGAVSAPAAGNAAAASAAAKDTGQRVAICYNTLKTSPETVQQLAQAECVGSVVAERVATDYHLDNCPLLTPGRATFVCRRQ